MVFYPTGHVGWLACYLSRQANGTVTISRGDGFVVKIGTWEKANGTVTVRSRTVYREIVVTGQAIPASEVIEQFRDLSRDGYWRLRKGQERFEPLPGFVDFDFLGAAIACDRVYYDGD